MIKWFFEQVVCSFETTRKNISSNVRKLSAQGLGLDIKAITFFKKNSSFSRCST